MIRLAARLLVLKEASVTVFGPTFNKVSLRPDEVPVASMPVIVTLDGEGVISNVPVVATAVGDQSLYDPERVIAVAGREASRPAVGEAHKRWCVVGSTVNTCPSVPLARRVGGATPPDGAPPTMMSSCVVMGLEDHPPT
jgi:hypothetical protein